MVPRQLDNFTFREVESEHVFESDEPGQGASIASATDRNRGSECNILSLAGGHVRMKCSADRFK